MKRHILSVLLLVLTAALLAALPGRQMPLEQLLELRETRPEGDAWTAPAKVNVDGRIADYRRVYLTAAWPNEEPVEENSRLLEPYVGEPVNEFGWYRVEGCDDHTYLLRRPRNTDLLYLYRFVAFTGQTRE